MKERHFSLVKTFSLSKTTIWELLANTDHLNRLIGLFPVQFSEVLVDDVLFYRKAKAKAGMIPLSWKEYPFEWVKEERYVVQRIYTSGPLAEFNGGIELKDVSTNENVATEVHIFSTFRPANGIGKLALPAVALPAMKKTLAYVEDYLAMKPSKLTTLPQPKKLSSANKQTLTHLLDRLPPSPLREVFREHLDQSADQDVVSMQPYKLADQWGEDRDEVLELFLEATKAGLLNLSWSLMCPNCRVPKKNASTLKEVENSVHCDMCGISYEMNFDETIELRFTVHPSVREAIDQTYCVGGPMITPHIVIQKRISSGSSSKLPAQAHKENLQLRVLAKNHTARLNQEAHHDLTYTEKGFSHEEFSLLNGKVYNLSEQDIVLIVEETNRDPYAVTAAKVTTMTPFRRLFSSEVLAKGQEIGIENVTILFSDLRGSTSLYESAGDAPAYRQVSDHFDFLSGWISTYNGSIIKTIGDSIMAVFFSPEKAVQAALDIQGSVKEFNEAHKTNLSIKLGLFNGPAIAVTANSQLDYFGHTVNMAARIEQESKGGDVILPADMMNRASIAEQLQQYGIHSYTAKLNGIKEPITLIRVDVVGSLSKKQYA